MNVDSINKFVFGVKGLELWNNMACWILREDQNADSGLTVFSLGGLSAANMPHATLKTAGTPPGLPVWSTNGVVFSGDNDGYPQNYMESGSFTFNISGATVFSVINYDYAGLNTNVTAVDPTIMGILPTRRADVYQFPRRIELKRNSPTPANANPSAYQSKYGLVIARNGYGEINFGNGPNANDDNNNWAVAGMSYLSGSQLFSRNGGNFVNGTVQPLLPYLSPGGPESDDAAIGFINEDYRLMTGTVLRDNRDGFRGTSAAYFYFNKFLSQQEHTKLYTLYKETLGEGLGLP
jgi:hypothetical protein